MDTIQLSEPTAMQGLLLAQERTAELKAELKRWQASYDSCLVDALRVAEFGEDRFLKAIKRRGDSYRDGDIKLIRKPTVRRTIRRDDFMKAYPEIFMRIGQVPLKQAEEAIGKESLDQVCDIVTSYSYEAVDMRGE